MRTKPSEAVVNASVVTPGTRKEVDFTKKWTDGHIVLDATQSGALTELLHQEDAARERFNKYKDTMSRPRNPLNGEPTPRDQRGAVVANPKMCMTVANGIPLLREHDPNMSTTKLRARKPDLPGKIGVSEDIYKVLGNTGLDLNPSQPQDLFMVTRQVNRQKMQRQEEQSRIGEFVAKEKAKRYQTDLAREIQYLQQQMEEKSKKLTQLQSHFNI